MHKALSHPICSWYLTVGKHLINSVRPTESLLYNEYKVFDSVMSRQARNILKMINTQSYSFCSVSQTKHHGMLTNPSYAHNAEHPIQSDAVVVIHAAHVFSFGPFSAKIHRRVPCFEFLTEDAEHGHSWLALNPLHRSASVSMISGCELCKRAMHGIGKQEHLLVLQLVCQHPCLCQVVCLCIRAHHRRWQDVLWEF